MKGRLIFFLVTALIGVLIVMLINNALKTKQATIEALQHGRADIVVAARSLAPGNVVDAASIKLAAWPRDNLPPGAVTSTSQVQGQMLKQAVFVNEPIVSTMLLEPGKGGGVLPFLIPEGMRAMSIPVTPVSDMAGMILPHTRVDVLVTIAEGNGSNERTRIVLQDVEVLAAQTTLEAPDNAPQHAEVVTLLVSPSDAERLAAAIRLGTLQVAMRSYGDRHPIWTAGTDARELLGLPRTVAVAQQAPSITPRRSAPRPQVSHMPKISVEIMRNGKDRQTVNFERMSALATSSEIASSADPRRQADPPATELVK